MTNCCTSCRAAVASSNKEFSDAIPPFKNQAVDAVLTLTCIWTTPHIRRGFDANGWGVNDDETFASIIASKTNSSFKLRCLELWHCVREIMRLRMHPRFQEANCIFIQYSWNDFQ